MTKTLRTTHCLLVVLSSLILGCAQNLPEPPLDVIYGPEPTPVSTSVTETSPAPLPSSVLSAPPVQPTLAAQPTLPIEPTLPVLPTLPVQATLAAQPTIPVLNGEVTFAETKIDRPNNFPLDLIADDLVKALSFISGMDSGLLSLYAPAPGSVFDNLVTGSMEKQGYIFDGRRFRSGTQQLTTSFVETNSELQRREITAIMAINSVLIKRTYVIQPDFIEPGTPYTIRGIKPELVDTNEQVRTL